eukprot:3036099-Pyramimonas_sp.AAC.1
MGVLSLIPSLFPSLSLSPPSLTKQTLPPVVSLDRAWSTHVSWGTPLPGGAARDASARDASAPSHRARAKTNVPGAEAELPGVEAGFPEDAATAVEQTVRAVLRETLEHPAEGGAEAGALSSSASLWELGMTSATAVAFSGALEAELMA